MAVLWKRRRRLTFPTYAFCDDLYKMHSAFRIVLQVLHQTVKAKSFFLRCYIKVK